LGSFRQAARTETAERARVLLSQLVALIALLECILNKKTRTSGERTFSDDQSGVKLNAG
jgi:hypothetical protein